jgi:hypothetical protein
MRRFLLAVFAGALACPVSVAAWGADTHRLIMSRAIDLLPPEIKPFYEAHRAEVELRVNDPDLWRTAGWDDNANHFLDFGASEYGAPPFEALPREYGAALEKFGPATVRRNGLLPWRLAELFGRLRRAFAGFASGAEFAVSDVIVFSSAAAHYLQDAHQPLHATDNYDGQLSRQQGVHARFEVDLFDRFQSRLTLAPAAVSPMREPRDAAFDVLLESHRLAASLLEADRESAAGREWYDEGYFEAFFSRTKPLIERRVGESVSATASMIVGAWQEAGRPTLVARMKRPLRKVPPPR